MPVISSDYRPPLQFRSGHLSTIYSGLFRRVGGLHQERERIELADGDFMDLDWSFADGASMKTGSGDQASTEKLSTEKSSEGKAFLKTKSREMAFGGRTSTDKIAPDRISREKAVKKVAILLHGLEGNAQRPYITGSAKAFNEAGIDACAVNFRGCSGETNRLFRSYHSGATEDLDAVVQHILLNKKYSEIYIKGISLGGNMALKYVGEDRTVPKEIKAVIGVSVPCNLYSSLKELLKPKNYAYSVRFRNHLVTKLKLKLPLFPDKISKADIKRIKTLKDFDDIYTAPAHGFKNALDYYEKCSCRQFLPDIRVPSLIINAKNDSFIGTECYPFKEAKENAFIHLEIPKFGGHVGFFAPGNRYYSEKRAIKFLEEAV